MNLTGCEELTDAPRGTPRLCKLVTKGCSFNTDTALRGLVEALAGCTAVNYYEVAIAAAAGAAAGGGLTVYSVQVRVSARWVKFVVLRVTPSNADAKSLLRS